MQIVTLVLVLLRVWILYGRTRNITIALIAAFILYISANIGVFAYILSAINCKSSRAAKRHTETVTSSSKSRFRKDVRGRAASWVLCIRNLGATSCTNVVFA